MTKFLNFFFCLIIILLTGCITDGKTTHDHKTGIKYILIKDNLYHDNSGRLYLKSYDHPEDNSKKFIVWLTSIYCDTCFVQNENEVSNFLELKDCVDTATFHFDNRDFKQWADIYEDKNYSYFHKLMADGGTITLFEK